MRVFNVTYDLADGKGDDYDELLTAIRAYGNYLHALASTWLVAVGDDVTASSLCEALLPHVKRSDSLLVMEVTDAGYAGNLTDSSWAWIRRFLGG